MSHQGLVKGKDKAITREKIWFPRVDDSKKQKIDNYIACQANSSRNHPDPIQLPLFPPEP